MNEQTATNTSALASGSSVKAGSTTTVSDATLERFACSFEASARRWEIVVYPMMLAFVILAAYGFYLIYSMTRDVHRVTEQMEPIAQRMQYDADVMTQRIHDVTGPMNFMSDMFPMGKERR
jgi:hypothetical protein